MGIEPVDLEELTAGSRRARAVRYDGHPLRAHSERHPTFWRNILLIAGFIVLAVLAFERVSQYVY